MSYIDGLQSAIYCVDNGNKSDKIAYGSDDGKI